MQQNFAYIAVLLLFATNCPDAKGQKVCKDQLPRNQCKTLKKYCVSHFKRMEIYCPETCNFCNGVCLDFFDLKCKVWVWHGACKTHTSMLKKYCKKSCGFCAAAAPPKKAACAFSPFGCCWDKVSTAFGPNNLGCKPCKDRYKFCRRFFTECITGRNRPFMRKHCPETCRMCGSSKEAREITWPKKLN